MKKNIWIMTLIVFWATVSLVSAQGMDGEMMGKGMMDKEMMGKGMGKGMMGHMHKMMMQKSLVATSDGGVIVMTANQLLKYDKNLNLVKEVDIQMDMEGMQKMMTDMMEKCPMMMDMMKGMTQEDSTDSVTEADKDVEKPNTRAIIDD